MKSCITVSSNDIRAVISHVIKQGDASDILFISTREGTHRCHSITLSSLTMPSST